MKTAFKTGDRVKTIGKLKGYDSVKGKLFGTVGRNGTYIGQFGTWVDIIWDKDNIGFHPEDGGYYPESFELVKGKKPKPYKFALQYELDQDPTEYFHDMKEVKSRVKELCANSSLKRDQIYVHEIKKTHQIKVTSVIGIKFVSLKE